MLEVTTEPVFCSDCGYHFLWTCPACNRRTEEYRQPFFIGDATTDYLAVRCIKCRRDYVAVCKLEDFP